MTKTQILKGQVVLVWTDEQSKSRRPAVVVAVGSNEDELLSVVPLTTKTTNKASEILLSRTELQMSNIDQELRIDCSVVGKVHPTHVVAVLGQLPGEKVEQILTKLRNL